jgi:5-methylcytosine-specific restriction endonuclease McrA
MSNISTKRIPKSLRLKILKRDNYTCQNCGNTDKKMHVHHKIDKKEMIIKDKKTGKIYRLDLFCYPLNLITFCISCHTGFHNQKRKYLEFRY